mmetsp:Transcript_29862/g.33325  ORF Transcript_29862/g.33325 Transcript_29862/m.33325 type:complete len:362 (+) Transcript_29862:35-1120(+)
MMKAFLFAVLFSLAVVAVVGEGESSDVVDLTPDNFDEIVDGSKAVFVEFFAPWCGHCKRLAPDYEIFGTAFAKIDSVVIAKVDADKHKELGKRFGVSGFPTLKFFPKGATEPEDYKGGRSVDELVTFVNNKAGVRGGVSKPASAVVELGPDNFDEIVNDESVDAFVEFFAPWCGHCKRLAPIWEQLAGIYKNDKLVIASVDADKHKTLGQRFDVSGYPTLKVFPKDNKAGEAYNGGRELSDFIKYCNENFGLFRTESGLLNDQAGLVESMEEFAKGFLADDASKEDLIVSAEAALKTVEEADKWSAGFYVKFMKVIVKRGVEFVDKEIERTNGLLAGDSLSLQKKDEFAIRRNILSVFKSE